MTRSTRATTLWWAGVTPSPTRARLRALRLAVGVAAAAWSSAVLLAFSGVRVAPRPDWLLLATGLASALAAAGALWIAAARGRNMLGRSTATLAAVVVALPVALFAWKVGMTACAEGMSDVWPGRWGERCLYVSLLAGAGPFAALLWARRRSVTEGARWAGAAVGAAAGTVGWLVNDLRCQVANAPHLLLGHVLPLVVFVAGGVAVARWLEPRWISRS
jgi:hypothetical protein